MWSTRALLLHKNFTPTSAIFLEGHQPPLPPPPPPPTSYATATGIHTSAVSVGMRSFYSTGIIKATDFSSSIRFLIELLKPVTLPSSTGSTRLEAGRAWGTHITEVIVNNFTTPLYQPKPVEPLVQLHSTNFVHQISISTSTSLHGRVKTNAPLV